MTVHNKLVRDLIPAIIEEDNKQCTIEILNEADYKRALSAKLTEELHEYQATKSDADALEELADMLEVIHALAKTHGSDHEGVEQIRQDKAVKRGGFAERIFLIDVTD